MLILIKCFIIITGSAFQVICLSCAEMTMRHDFQKVLYALNSYLSFRSGSIRPDGDVELTQVILSNYYVCFKNKVLDAHYFKPPLRVLNFIGIYAIIHISS